MSTTTTPQACIWWSPTHTAWGCQRGNDRRYFYSEQQAIEYAEAVYGCHRSTSLIEEVTP